MAFNVDKDISSICKPILNWGVIQYKRILENLGFNTVKYILKSGIQAVNA